MCSRWSDEILKIRTRILAPALMTFCPHSTGLWCSMCLLACLNLKYCSLVLTRLTVFCLFVVASSDSPLLTNFRLHSRHGSRPDQTESWPLTSGHQSSDFPDLASPVQSINQNVRILHCNLSNISDTQCKWAEQILWRKYFLTLRIVNWEWQHHSLENIIFFLDDWVNCLRCLLACLIDSLHCALHLATWGESRKNWILFRQALILYCPNKVS